MTAHAGTRAVRVVVVDGDPGGPRSLGAVLVFRDDVEVAGESASLHEAMQLAGS